MSYLFLVSFRQGTHAEKPSLVRPFLVFNHAAIPIPIPSQLIYARQQESVHTCKKLSFSYVESKALSCWKLSLIAFSQKQQARNGSSFCRGSNVEDWVKTRLASGHPRAWRGLDGRVRPKVRLGSSDHDLAKIVDVISSENLFWLELSFVVCLRPWASCFLINRVFRRTLTLWVSCSTGLRRHWSQDHIFVLLDST